MKNTSPIVAGALALALAFNNSAHAQASDAPASPATNAQNSTSFDVFGDTTPLRPGEQPGTIIMMWCDNSVYKGTMVFANSESDVKRIVKDSAYGVNGGVTQLLGSGAIQETYSFAVDSTGKLHDISTNDSAKSVDKLLEQGLSMQYDHRNVTKQWADNHGPQLCLPKVSSLQKPNLQKTGVQKKSGQARGLTA